MLTTPASGRVFKIERGGGGERVAYVRMFAGTVRTRDRLHFGHELQDKVTAISVFERGSVAQRTSVSAGEIGKVSGLDPIQIGDWIGVARTDGTHRQFAPPTLESVVVAASPDEPGTAPRRPRPARRAGPADQRPTGRHPQRDVRVALRRGAEGGHPGDVGKRLRHRRHLPGDHDDLHRAPGRNGSGRRTSSRRREPIFRNGRVAYRTRADRDGVDFRLDVDPRSVPTYIYKTRERFIDLMTQYVLSHAPRGSVRLAGNRLRRDDDRLRLLRRRRPHQDPPGRRRAPRPPTSASSRRSS